MEFLYGLAFLVLFSLSAVVGMILRTRLHENHLSKENMDALSLVTGLLVTFAALVLGLQLSTAKATFDAADKDRSVYAAKLARLDQCLRDLGPTMDPARSRLRQYTAAVIASTWRHEPAPLVPGTPDTRGMAISGEDVTLSALMNQIGLIIDTAAPSDASHVNIATRCRTDFGLAQESRWAVIEDAIGTSPGWFTGILSFWLVLVFLSFGLQIPRRLLGAVVLGIGVVAISSVMFAIVDLEIPYGGMFGIKSTAMRAALADMNK
ncbi:hypothetical protein [Pseudaminobacter soli (ex Li et al. 2025)]|uniref:DUF4239 domain-containing protein n=1 Tax=Pseudaminobacter soli (ex Li et al. 2025) TaxID=1295366 RepID=A0A2P7SGS3_9HYPH|nr:hypothetical protein [Mesorhizobium soli]PSJ61531.1 hypothetical protein C7I85_10820 [Mesorhizobium soli]